MLTGNHLPGEPGRGPEEFDLTKNDFKPVPDPEDVSEDAPYALPFDRDEHHDKTASKAVWALLVLLGLIIVGSFVLMMKIEHMEIHYIELWIFSLLALVTIVSRPIMSYLSDKAE